MHEQTIPLEARVLTKDGGPADDIGRYGWDETNLEQTIPLIEDSVDVFTLEARVLAKDGESADDIDI